MQKVRYAVVGAGWISQAAFMPGVAHTGNSEMTAIVTGDSDKAEQLGRLYGIKSAYHYDAWQAAIDSRTFDAVYLALPNDQHRKFAIPALEAGLHVLLEKPMATSEADCRAIIDAATRGRAKLMLAYRLHFEPATLEALRLVHGQHLGQARLFTSTFTQHVAETNHRANHGFWAGPVSDMGPYPINAARMVFGAEPDEVMAWGLNTLGRNYHDIVSILLRFPGDRMAQFTVAYGLNAINEWRVVGTDGDLLLNPGFTFPGPLKHQLRIGDSKTRSDFPAVDQFGGETQYFSDCILNDLDPEPDGEEGLLDVRVIEAIERALTTGQPQTLAPYRRAKAPLQTQKRDLPAITPPRLINAAEPAEG